MARRVLFATFSAAVLAACGVTLTGDEETTPPSEAGVPAEGGTDDGSSGLDGNSASDAPPDNTTTDAAEAGCTAETTAGCPCGTVCASKVCSNGACDPLVFVSTTTFAANLGSTEVIALGFADAQCDRLASNITRMPTTTFKAWLSTQTMKVENRFVRSKRPYRLGDVAHTMVVTSFDAFNFDLIHSIDVTQTGASLGTSFEVWTGTDRGGVASGTDCAGWTSNDMVSSIGSFGITSATDARWTRDTEGGCNIPRRLYCLEQLP